MTSEPIDKQQMSMPAVAALMVMATGTVFGIGMGVAAWEARLAAVEHRNTEISRIRETVTEYQSKMDRLGMVICMETPDSADRCKQLGLIT